MSYILQTVKLPVKLPEGQKVWDLHEDLWCLSHDLLGLSLCTPVWISAVTERSSACTACSLQHRQQKLEGKMVEVSSAGGVMFQPSTWLNLDVRRKVMLQNFSGARSCSELGQMCTTKQTLDHYSQRYRILKLEPACAKKIMTKVRTKANRFETLL